MIGNTLLDHSNADTLPVTASQPRADGSVTATASSDVRPRGRKPGWLGLHRRISLFVALGLLVALATFGVLGVQAVTQATERELQQRLILTQMAAGQLDRTLLATLRNIEAMAAVTTLEPAPGKGEALAPVLHLLRAQTDPRAARLDLLDQNGLIVASDPYDPAVLGHTLLGDDSFANVFQSGNAMVASLPADASGKHLVALAAPVRDPAGRIHGVLAGEFDLSDPNLLGFLRPMRLGATGEVQIVDEQGNLLGSVDQDDLDAEVPNHARFAELVRRGVPTVGICHDCHVANGKTFRRQDVMAFAPLSIAPMGVLLRQSAEEAFAHAQSLRWNMVAFGLFLLLGGLALAQLVTRSVVKPIEGLTAAAQRIATGDLASPVPAMGHSEIAVLSEAFDEMRGRLRDSLDEIERWNETLENRVVQRTRELSALLRAANTLTSTLDLNALLSLILSGAVETFRAANVGLLMLYDRAHEQLVARASVGFDPAAVRRLRLKPGESIAGTVFASGKEVLCVNAAEIAEARASLSDVARRHLEAAESSLPPMAAAMCAPLVAKNRVMGCLFLAAPEAGAFSSSDTRLLRAMADQAAVSVENAQLYDEVRRSEEARGELLAKLIGAQEEERHRIARELHDETSQALTALVMSLAQLRKATPVSLRAVHAGIDEMDNLAGHTLDEIHRLVYDLRPTLLDDLGLIPAIQWYLETQSQRTGIEFRLAVDGMAERLPPQIETVLFRIIQEAVTNVVRHAEGSAALVRVRREGDEVLVTIEDDGKGFDARAALRRGGRAGVGILGMRERVHLFGGRFNIASRPSKGTKLSVELPLAMKEYKHDPSTVG